MNKRNWLFEIRNKCGLTQEEVAKLAAIKRPYYTMIENGVRRPSVDVAKRIGKALSFNWTIFYDHDCVETIHLKDEKTAIKEAI